MGNHKHLTPIILALIGGAFLLYLSTPQLVGGVKLIRHERSHDNLGVGAATEPLAPGVLTDAVARWAAAAPLLDDGQAWTEYGDFLMAAAHAAPDRAGRALKLEAAVRAYHKALARGPANGRAWTMLAAARAELDATPEELATLLSMSLRAAPREPGLVFTRLDLAFYIWPLLEGDLRAAMTDQVRIAARQNANMFARIVRRHHLLEPVRDMLADDPDAKWRFEEWYTRLFP